MAGITHTRCYCLYKGIMIETEGQTRLLAPWGQEYFTVSIIFESPDSQIDIED